MYLSPLEIEPNPQNPRLLFDQEPLAILQKSIREVGILVPLLVYQKANGRYVILDGQRRWQCATDLKMSKVPVNMISEPTTIQNILTMFNIHNVREEWELAPTALKLEVVMRVLKSTDEETLSKLTGLTAWNVKRCRVLLSFPKKYLDMTIVPDPQKRLKGDFFVELHPALELIKDTFPRIYAEYTRNGITDRMLGKYRAGDIKAVTEFRDLVKLIKATKKGASRKDVERLLRSILERPGIGIRQAFKSSEKIIYDAEKIVKACRNLERSLAKLDASRLKDASVFLKSLRALRRSIDHVLERVEARR